MSDPQAEFVPLQNRDAWATIRGYVYQVDVTVQRWLELRAGEELQLECGEDIDIVQSIFLNPDNAQTRVLEQVKQREKSVTLKSSHALHAVVSFLEHKANNPTLGIKFRYLTNSRIGREYNSPMPDGEPAIKVWEKIRKGSIPQERLGPALSGIRTVLSRAPKPTKLSSVQWRHFQEFPRPAGNEALLQSIHCFEWSTRAPTFNQIQQSNQADLLRTGRALTREGSQALYERLFLFVVKRLSVPGRKTLTTEDLEATLSRPGIEPGGQRLMTLVKDLLGSVGERLRRLEERAIESHDYLKRIDADLGLLAPPLEFHATVEYAIQKVPLDTPPLVERATRRPAGFVNLVWPLLIV